MKFLLDTNVCVDYFNGRFLPVVKRIQSADPEDLVVSAIAVAELRYGADKSKRSEANHARIDALLEDLSVLEFSIGAAKAYGKLRARLESAGEVIGPNDMLIAAQALATGTVLVSANTEEFTRIGGLEVVNWRDEIE